MDEHKWIGGPRSDQHNKSDRPQEGKQDAETAYEPPGVRAGLREESQGADKAGRGTVAELRGDRFKPLEIFAVVALVDIAAVVKKIRPVPELYHLKKPVTIIGTGGRAQIRVDDFQTVEPEHGAIAFQEGRFVLYPQEGRVSLNGVRVLEEGMVLTNGSRIEMGSARFLFLTTVGGEQSDQTRSL